MIKGVHAMFYSSDADELRIFIRDILGFKATDVGDGWLIFELPEADMGCHPSDDSQDVPSGTQDISFYCDNLEQTVKELKAKGVIFRGEIEERSYGKIISFKMPGNFFVQLYQPFYKK